MELSKAPSTIWLTWEHQRRSIELAEAFSAELLVLDHNGPSFSRYPRLILKTIKILKSKKPKVLFVQNPSMVLAFVACIYRIISKTPVIVDRHSNFMLATERKVCLRGLLFYILNKITLKAADLTIVTNQYIAERVKDAGGKPFILPDKIPELRATRRCKLKGEFRVLLISSFGDDEPVEEVLKAASYLLNHSVHFYITGNYKNLPGEVVKSAPPNVHFTGFVAEQEFLNLLFSVDTVMVLTTIDECMLCGCYEAYAAGMPLITSRKRVLEEYFKGAVFTENNPEAIKDAILQVCCNLELYRNKINMYKAILIKEWKKSFDLLTELVFEISRLKRI